MIFTFGFSSAQKEGNVWYFGNSTLLDFNTDPPAIGTQARMYSRLSSSSLCDKEGKLLFYTHGWKIFNDTFEMVKNWIVPNGYYPVSEALEQGTLLLPCNDTLFYFFSLITSPTISGYLIRYSLISTRNDPHGEISSIDLHLGDTLTCHLAAVRHANGKSWWLISHRNEADTFFVWRLDPNGQISRKSQRVGGVHAPYWTTYASPLIFNESGTQFALTTALGSVEIFDFDRCSGDISFRYKIDKGQVYENSFLGIAFSPSGQFLYISDRFVLHKSRIFQYDLNRINIQASEIKVGETPEDSMAFIGMKLAPDGSILIGYEDWQDYPNSVTRSSILCTIEKPDERGLASDYRWASFSIEPGRGVNFPNLPNYNLTSLSLQPVDAGPAQEYCAQGNPVTLGVPDTSHGLVSFLWWPALGLNDSTLAQPQASPALSTTYHLESIDVTLGPDCGMTQDSVTVTVAVSQIPDAGPDQTVCRNVEAVPIGLSAAQATDFQCRWWSAQGGWTPAGLSDPNSCHPMALSEENTEYFLYAADLSTGNGCQELVDSVTVYVQACDIIIPTFLSQDGDGLNDLWKIQNLPIGAEVEVYDLCGKLIFRSLHYENTWPEQPLPVGIYLYRIRTGEGTARMGDFLTGKLGVW